MSRNYESKEVILCRGIIEKNSLHDEYIETFKSAGFNCHHLPTLRFEFVNLQQLRDSLFSPNFYGGLIVTSRRAIEAIIVALQGNCLPEEWQKLPIYCVGPATKALVENDLKLNNCVGFDCGNAKDLANFIVTNAQKGENKLLYPCSAIARDTILRILNENEIIVEKIVVYNTLPTETLEADVKNFINESPKIFVFFSPSAVEYILNALAEKNDLIRKIIAVAIGPATAEALSKFGLIVKAISSKPEPEALLHAIQSAEL